MIDVRSNQVLPEPEEIGRLDDAGLIDAVLVALEVELAVTDCEKAGECVATTFK